MALLDLISGRKGPRFEKQIRPYLHMLYRYAYRLSGNQHDSEDVVQDLLVQLYDKNINLDTLENPKTWLLKSLYHKFIDHTRKQSRNPGKPGDQVTDDLLSQLPDPNDPLKKAIEHQDTHYQLHIALENLNPDQKAVIILHDIEGHNIAEISQILDTPVGTLKSRLHRARNELKKVVSREPLSQHRRVNG